MATAPDPEIHPQGDERTLLTGYLDWYRSVLIRKCEGLSDAQASTVTCEPSILTLLGLVRHLADVERSWFRRRFDGVDVAPRFWTADDPDRDLEVSDGDTMVEAMAALNEEIAHARSLVAAAPSLDEVSRLTGDERRPGWQPNLRWILIHLIEEYARHCGHADLIRERIDGATGD